MTGALELDEKVALVTGAGRGIGRAVALELARSGWAVMVNDLGTSLDGGGSADESPAQQVAEEIRAGGGRAAVSGASVADPDQARAMVETTVSRLGRLDGVVNCAGILRDKIFHKLTDEDWASVIQVHLMGSFAVSRAAAPIFRAQGSGAFVHMTSTSGLIGNVAQANYSAAKMGIVALSRSIALDMARFNVRSNAIAPFAWSRLIGTLPEDTPQEKDRVARMKLMTPEQVAPLAAYLLGEDSAEISGQVFVVRGNEIMLMSQPRPVRALHRSDGWQQSDLVTHLGPAIRSSLVPLETSPQVFSYDPI